MNKELPKIIMIHGNGGGTNQGCWFPWVSSELTSLGFSVICPTMPDNIEAKSSIWLPYISKLGANEQTILIGHSSGAVAAMRFAESHPILGSILISGCYTDLGEESERVSGYYDHPWLWDEIIKNQKWIVQLSSQDDLFIPIHEPRFIHEHLNSEYHEFVDREHFGWPTDVKKLPEIIEIITRKVQI